MGDDLNFSGNGRRPQFQEMEDDLNISENERRRQFLKEMEDDLKFFRKWKTTSVSGNGRRPQYFRKFKTNSTFQEMEGD